MLQSATEDHSIAYGTLENAQESDMHRKAPHPTNSTSIVREENGLRNPQNQIQDPINAPYAVPSTPNGRV